MKIKNVLLIVIGTVFLVACASVLAPDATALPTVTPTVAIITSAATFASQGEPTGNLLEQDWSITGDPNQFKTPDGIAVDAQGNLYVMDSGNNRIQKFDSSGHFVTMWGSAGRDDGQFDCSLICMVAVDYRGNVFVTDTGNARIQKFDANGKFLTKWGSFGSGDGQFNGVFGIGLDSTGNIYVGDVGNYRVQKFTSDGKFQMKWGSSGYKNGQFSSALADIAVDQQGYVYVTDRSNGLQKFDSSGRFIGIFDHCGDTKPFFSATGVAVDLQDNVYAFDLARSRICKYDSNGRFLDWWDASNSIDGKLSDVGGVAVDQQGNLYVAELFIGRVRKFLLP